MCCSQARSGVKSGTTFFNVWAMGAQLASWSAHRMFFLINTSWDLFHDDLLSTVLFHSSQRIPMMLVAEYLAHTLPAYVLVRQLV